MLAHLVLLLIAQGSAPPPGYWASLQPGPHPVGFSQRWIIDSTRRLPHAERYGLRYRPILLNLWYPAGRPGPRAMNYGDYFAGAIRAAGGSPGLASYAAALMRYQRGVAWEELARTEPDSTAPDLRQRIEELFHGPTPVFRDAPRAPALGVVVYTQGAQSSLDDNVVLCEYLASRGYLVIGSAYPKEDGSDFATRVEDHSRPRDIRRLLLEVARREGTPGAVTVIGHSAGAQAMLWFATDPSAPIDAILALDTTEDYAMLSDRTWAYYTDAVVRDRADIRIPIGFVAGPDALFELADSLSDSERWLLTAPGLGHNEFISQGNLRRQLLDGLAGGDGSARAAAERSYRALLEWTGDWLDARRAPGRADRGPAAAAPLHATRVHAGVRFPDLGSAAPATARELRHLFGSVEPERFAELAVQLKRTDSVVAGNPVIMMLLVDAIRRGDTARAHGVYRALAARDSTVARIPGVLERRAALFERIQAKEEADEWHRLAQVIGGFARSP